jgi:DNA-binding CsgD family transcriptional regulator
VQLVAVLALAAQLTPSEHEALRKAISSESLEERSLREGCHGEIVNYQGRTIFEVGFARVIRKILGD